MPRTSAPSSRGWSAGCLLGSTAAAISGGGGGPVPVPLPLRWLRVTDMVTCRPAARYMYRLTAEINEELVALAHEQRYSPGRPGLAAIGLLRHGARARAGASDPAARHRPPGLGARLLLVRLAFHRLAFHLSAVSNARNGPQTAGKQPKRRPHASGEAWAFSATPGYHVNSASEPSTRRGVATKLGPQAGRNPEALKSCQFMSKRSKIMSKMGLYCRAPTLRLAPT